MKKVRQLILFSTLFLLLFSCKKNDPPETSNEPVLPPMTQEGLNTFGCYINGELFVANDGESVVSLPAVSGSFDEEEKFLRIQGSREVERTESNVKSDAIRFRVKFLDIADEYEMYFETDHYDGYSSFGLSKCEYFHDLSNRGSATIKYLNEEKNIIAGTFYMTLINPDCEGDTVMYNTPQN